MGRKGKTQEHEEQNANHKEHIINQIPEDTRRLGPPFPLQSLVLTQIHQFMDLSHKNPKGMGKLGKEEREMKEVWEMGAPSSYLTGLLYNPSFALRYFELNHITRGRYGPTRGNLHPMTTMPFMR
jgi:hypothetical protein